MNEYTLHVRTRIDGGEWQTYSLDFPEHVNSAAIRMANAEIAGLKANGFKVGAATLVNNVSDETWERSLATDWEWAGID